MRIAIRKSLHPFSLQPGFRCIIPLTTWEVQVFPTKAFLCDLVSGNKAEIVLPFGGNFDGFKVTLDLERGRVEVGAKGRKPKFITAEAHPDMQKSSLAPSKKQLSLGIHKKQDWDLMSRRSDMAEVFPLWIKLADWVPEVDLPRKKTGTMHLLNSCTLRELFLAGFEGLLCPRFSDPRHLGFIERESGHSKACPIGLIHAGARLIEAFFFSEEGSVLHLLPQLPVAFHSGRFIHLETSHGDRIDIEWSKKSLKKVVLHPAKERQIFFGLQSKLRSFRVRTDLRKRGGLYKRGAPLHIKPGQTLFCDRFTHS